MAVKVVSKYFTVGLITKLSCIHFIGYLETSCTWLTGSSVRPSMIRLTSNTRKAPVHQLAKTCTLIAVIKPNTEDTPYTLHCNKHGHTPIMLCNLVNIKVVDFTYVILVSKKNCIDTKTTIKSIITLFNNYSHMTLSSPIPRDPKLSMTGSVWCSSWLQPWE